MAANRPSLGFGGELDAFDPDAFGRESWSAAHPKPRAPAPAETARSLAESVGFKSRESAPPAEPASAPPARADRRRRTGRNAQFNLKARPETIAAFCAVADRQGWGLGETLEKAVALLEERHGGGPARG